MLYFVATLSRYVLAEADDADQARTRALPELQRLYDEDPPPGGQPFPITIRTSRPATPDEIETWKWFQDKRLEQHNLEETSTMQPPETPEERIADVLRLVAMRLELAVDAGRRSPRIDANDLLETLLSVADELDPPIPEINAEP